ncbi:hypothetical protein J25TS5_52340 [Paenibacillus faecis]|nr:hypothetical protein J25TS5_52340 [Paenibacillus faecis]
MSLNPSLNFRKYQRECNLFVTDGPVTKDIIKIGVLALLKGLLTSYIRVNTGVQIHNENKAG